MTKQVVIQWNPRTWSIKEAFVVRLFPGLEHVNPWNFKLRQFGFATLEESEDFCFQNSFTVHGYRDIHLNEVTRNKMLVWNEFGKLPVALETA